MISLLMPTYRPGGLDVLAQSLQGVPGDYELVVVDDLPGRVGRGHAQRFLRECGIPLGWYGGSKQKSYPGTKGGLVNALNTGLGHCRGDRVVFISDYTSLPSPWLGIWGQAFGHYGKGTLVSGVAREWKAGRPADPDDVCTWRDGEASMGPLRSGDRPSIWRPDLRNGAVNLVQVRLWVAHPFETFYWGAWMEDLLRLDGFDERADHCHCWPVSSLVRQAGLCGMKAVVNPAIICDMVDHRVWDDEGHPAPWGAYDGMWRIMHGQSIEGEPDWTVPSHHPGWSLAQARKENGVA